MADRREIRDFESVKKTRSSNLAQLTRTYNDLKSRETNKLCLDLCEEQQIAENLMENFESCVMNFEEFKDRYSEWIAEGEKEKNTSEEEKMSVISGGSSYRSTVSSRSKLRTAMAKRLVAEQRLKSVTAKMELERKKKELDIEQQLLEYQSEIEEARVEESVWRGAVSEEEYINNTTNNTPNVKQSEPIARSESTCDGKVDSHTQNNNSRPTESYNSVIRRDVSSEIQRGVSSGSSIDSAFQKLAETLQEGFNLPKPELLTFRGSPTSYLKFIKNFETNIESKISDNQTRLSYLIQYCVGEARECIEDCVLLGADKRYVRARELLQSRYGRPHIIARSYISNLVHGSQIKSSDINGLSRLALEMQKCDTTLSQLGFASDIDSTENLRLIVRRLPMHLRSNYCYCL